MKWTPPYNVWEFERQCPVGATTRLASRHLRRGGHWVRFHMVFTRRLREGIRRGRIRCSIRIWTRPHVRVGGRYGMDEGHIVVDSIAPMAVTDFTDDLLSACAGSWPRFRANDVDMDPDVKRIRKHR